MKSIKNIWRKFSGKGYYIALGASAVAILIAGVLYYSNVGGQEPALKNLPGTDLPVLSTDPADTDAPLDQPAQPLKTAMPLTGQTVMVYSMDRLSYDPTTRDWRTHAGIDIAADADTPVTAAAAGTVYTTYDDELLGKTVVIRHQDGYVTTYASLADSVTVAPGDTVELGQTIGYVGCSAMLETALGDHLHFSVTCNDEPVDPANFFNQT